MVIGWIAQGVDVEYIPRNYAECNPYIRTENLFHLGPKSVEMKASVRVCLSEKQAVRIGGKQSFAFPAPEHPNFLMYLIIPPRYTLLVVKAELIERELK